MSVLLTEEIKKKWKPIIECDGVPAIQDKNVANATIQVLENTVKELSEASNGVGNAIGAGGTAGVDGAGPGIASRGYDPILIGMIRRVMPSLIANSIVGVQPMSGPTGLIFAMRTFYGTDVTTATGVESNTSTAPDQTFAAKNTTAAAELLGNASQVNAAAAGLTPVVQTNPWPEMSFRIDKVPVTAQSRALKASYTNELAQDLQAIHGMDAETELANILSGELVAEINRELIGLVFSQARQSGVRQNGTLADGVTLASTIDPTSTGTTGIFDMTRTTGDADGRWAVERYKSLLVQINKEAQQIAIDTRRGVGNYIITSANVCGALDMASKIDTTFVNQELQFDGVGATFVGRLAGRYNVYVDPYMISDRVVVGFNGANIYDSGIFYSPYVPLQMYRATNQDTFDHNIGFKTRYGISYNPFVAGTAGTNDFYRSFLIINL